MNTQITEDYVSFEVAKLLKEKGFDENCHSAWLYNPKEDVSEYFVEYLAKGIENNTELEHFNEPDTDWAYSAPTLQMAMKWLREVHKLYISLFSFDYQFDTYGWMFLIKPLRYVESVGWCWDSDHVQEKKWSNDMKYNTYEEACEAAIKYCLTNFI